MKPTVYIKRLYRILVWIGWFVTSWAFLGLFLSSGLFGWSVRLGCAAEWALLNMAQAANSVTATTISP
jgi:hypothetical protein